LENDCEVQGDIVMAAHESHAVLIAGEPQNGLVGIMDPSDASYRLVDVDFALRIINEIINFKIKIYIFIVHFQKRKEK
jgi:hypothetical protein